MLKRAGLGLLGCVAGGIVGLAASFTVFVGIAGLLGGGSSPSPGGAAQIIFAVAFIGVGVPCLVGGTLLFAFAPTGFLGLLVRMVLASGAAALYGYWWFDDSREGILLTVVVVSVPLWLLCILSLPVGWLFLKRRERPGA